MDFKLKRPCVDCPFRIEGGIRLTAKRAREIAVSQIDSQGGTFPCHKTVNYDDDGETVRSSGEQYCAGALAFAVNAGQFNQFLRIMARLGAWNPKDLTDVDACFRSVREMVAAQRTVAANTPYETGDGY